MASGASSSPSASSTQMGDLPRIDCPKCHIKVIRCRSKNNDVYYKCPNHFPNGSTCPYYWFEEAYVKYLRSNHPELLNPAGVKVAEDHADLKLDMCQLKLQMSEMKVQLGEVMLKIMETKEEIKAEVAKGNNPSPVFSCQIS